MKRIFLAIVPIIVSACSAIPKYPQYSGGEKISAPGFDFNLPKGPSWSLVNRSGYPIVFSRNNGLANESYIIGISRYEIPEDISQTDFLSLIKNKRTNNEEPNRYEVISNSEFISDQRKETCVVHHSISKDKGTIQSGNHKIFETYGMNCIDPVDDKVGVFIELSRKYSENTADSNFQENAASILESVNFPDLNDPEVKVYYSRVLIEKGNFNRAKELAESAVEDFKTSNDYVNAGSAYTSLGLLYTVQTYNISSTEKTYSSLEKEAISNYRNAVDSYKKGGDYWGATNAIIGIGDIYVNRDDHNTACSTYKEALRTYNKPGGRIEGLTYTWNPSYPSYKAMLESLITNACTSSAAN